MALRRPFVYDALSGDEIAMLWSKICISDGWNRVIFIREETRYGAMRKLTDVVSEGFIWGVGITRPSEKQQRRAALFITGILAGSVLFAAGMFFLLLQHIV
ncbi:MAG TPA: hypothetical protein VGC07_08670 [Granulicella sp.]